MWDAGCYIFGAISVIGPICLILWYLKGAKAQIDRLNAKKND